VPICVSRFTAKLFFSSAPAFTLERQASDLQPGAKWPVGRQYLGIVAAAHQPPTCFAAARLAQCSDLHRRWVNAWSRELNPDTKRNIGRRTFKREARRRLKNGAAENRLSLARSLLFLFIVRSTCSIADLEGDDARNSTSRPAVDSILRNSAKAKAARRGRARVRSCAPSQRSVLQNPSWKKRVGKNVACTRVVAE
jgi:hypothetical protein